MYRTLPLAIVLGACNGPQDESLPNDLAPTVLANSPEWGPVTDFLDSYDDRTRAIYAGAMGKFTSETDVGWMTCSGFLVSENVFVTAAHCEPKDNELLPLKAMNVTFGDPATQPEVEILHGLVNKRLHNYGKLASGESFSAYFQGSQGSEPYTDHCTHLHTEEDRDIAYYSCNGSGKPSAFPGAKWGYLEVGALGSRKQETPVWGMSVNDRCGEARTTLVAPGAYDRPIPCPFDLGSGCFGATIDVESGSSGGAILDAQHRVFGVQSARSEWYWDAFGNRVFWTDDRVYDDCNDASIYGVNVGTHLTDTLPELLVKKTAPGKLQGKRTKNTYTIGQRPGSAWLLKCPDHMHGIGLVGSSGIKGMVGSLGIVCSSSTFRTADTVVFAKGAWDTGYVDADGMSLNAYLAEVRQPEERVPDAKFFGTQTAALCPANFYLSGIHARRGSYVDGIDKLICTHRKGGLVVEVEAGDEEFGRIGSSPGGVSAEASCDVGSNIAGLYVWTADVTDGFTGYCRQHVTF